ncbi:MAG: PH domain-containing protein [Clostridia bacterium]|nr:PH domain-containing protein [Clostridia bacterium]
MLFKNKHLNKELFPCKHDWWITVLVWLTIGMAFYNSYVGGAPNSIKGMMGFILFFIGWIWFKTNYLVLDGLLVTWSGPFRNKVPIQYISSIEKTRNILFSPSFSFTNAILLRVGNKRIVVSPKNKRGFIDALLAQNPKIQVSKDVYM